MLETELTILKTVEYQNGSLTEKRRTILIYFTYIFLQCVYEAFISQNLFINKNIRVYNSTRIFNGIYLPI